jgi:apolipoprotein D and lipocalin family protein
MGSFALLDRVLIHRVPMRGSMRLWIGLSILVPALLLMSPTARAADVKAVEQLDITRYAGQWHEIARLPMFFQRNCVGEITAQYTLLDDGLVGVRNSCRNDEGEFEVVEGVARPVQGHPGQLEVRFAPDWLAWLPFTWADYWVIALDPDYQWAIVGEPGREYLWILARTPQIPRERLEELKSRAEAMGYALDELIVGGTTVDGGSR